MDMVKEEIEILREKTDEELMKIFANQLLGLFPYMVRVQALKVVMKEREIEPTDMTIIMPFKTRDGIKEVRIGEC